MRSRSRKEPQVGCKESRGTATFILLEPEPLNKLTLKFCPVSAVGKDSEPEPEPHKFFFPEPHQHDAAP
jgi:hypothetical protein